MAKAVAIKPEEQFARSYVDRLILEKLTEMEAAVKLGDLADKLASEGVGLAAVRALLASNPERFAYHERRWIPASRLESQGRPMAEALAITLDRFGGPMPIELLIQEVARVRKEPVALVEPVVRRIVSADPSFILTPQNTLLLTTWGFEGGDESLERGLNINEVNRDEFDDAAKKLEGFDFRSAESIRQALAAAAPIRLKLFGAVAWAKLNSQDPKAILMYDTREFTSIVVSSPGFVLGPEGAMHPEGDAKKWVATAIKAADRIAPTIEVEDAAPIEIKKADIDRLVARVLSNDRSTTATRLLEEFYEITPTNKTFPDDLANMRTALDSSGKTQWVGGDRYRKLGDVPEYIQEVPEPFQYPDTDIRDEEGELVDVELTDDGLSSTLRKLLQHPLAMDVLDEDIQPAPKMMPETVRLVLKSIHRELGTFPLCQLPTNWLDAQPNIQELIVIDPSGREQQVWVNHEARLTYNWIDWWYEQPVESGAVFTLTKTPWPNVVDFAWLDQPDPVVYISTQRMEELRQIAEESEGKSTLTLLTQVFSHWPKGADYLTLLAEVNVVRRASRRLIASLLSSYLCFYQRSGSPVWHFDPKKIEQGFDKTKRKFVRK